MKNERGRDKTVHDLIVKLKIFFGDADVIFIKIMNDDECHFYLKVFSLWLNSSTFNSNWISNRVIMKV